MTSSICRFLYVGFYMSVFDMSVGGVPKLDAKWRSSSRPPIPAYENETGTSPSIMEPKWASPALLGGLVRLPPNSLSASAGA